MKTVSYFVVPLAALLLLACPLFAVIAVLIKRSDGGPVFFRQRRVGRGGSEFELWDPGAGYPYPC